MAFALAQPCIGHMRVFALVGYGQPKTGKRPEIHQRKISEAKAWRLGNDSADQSNMSMFASALSRLRRRLIGQTSLVSLVTLSRYKSSVS